MKGPSLQKQYNNLTINGNIKLDIEEQTRFDNNCIYRTIRHELWELVIDKNISNCDLNCKNCKKCGLWAIDARYFVSCDQIMKIDFDIV